MTRASTYALGPGRVLTDGQRVARLAGWERDPAMGLVAVLECDDRIDRVPFRKLCERTPELASFEAADLPEPDDNLEWRTLPDDIRRRAIDMARHLNQVETGSPDGNFVRALMLGRVDPRYDPRSTTRRERILAKSAELRAHGYRGVSERRLYAKLRAFQGVAHSGLIDGRWQQRRDPLASVDPAAISVLSDLIAARVGDAKVNTRTLLMLARQRLDHAGFHELASSRALATVLGELTRGLALHRSARSRRTHSNRPDQPYGRFVVTRPGEVVQIDATPANVHCWFPDEGWLPATILTAIDCFTRQILALRVVPGAISTRDTCLLLWDITRPRVARLGAPFQLARWHGVPRRVVIDPEQTRLPREPTIGAKPALVPAVVVIDHGAEFDAAAFESACIRNEIEVVFARPGQATDKGIVESWHASLGDALMILPGYKGANPQNHPANAERDAALTVADLHDMLWTWILTVYHDRPHDGLRSMTNPALFSSPNLAFDQFIEHGGFIEVPHDPFRRLAFLPCETRDLQDAGIRVNNHFYNSPELYAIRPLVQRGLGTKPVQLTVYFDRWDLTRIYVRHPRERTWMCVPLAHPSHEIIAPFSDIVTRAAVESAVDGTRTLLNPDDLLAREVAVVAAWNAGAFTDLKQRRQHAAEQSRQQILAGEVENWPDELRAIAFFEPDRGLDAAGSDLSEAESDDFEAFDDDTYDGDDGLAL